MGGQGTAGADRLNQEEDFAQGQDKQTAFHHKNKF